jgi:phage FluMu protein Com
VAIKLVCTECGKRLQVEDQYAGRRVSCPKCKAVVRAPGEKVTKAAVPAAPPPAPPPPPPREERNPFGFESRSGGEPRQAPVKQRTGLVEVPDKPKDPAGSGRRESDNGEDRARPRFYGRGRGEPRRAPARAWAGFGAGCRLAQGGAWAEFVGFAVGVALLVYVAADAAEAGPPGPYSATLTFLGLGAVLLGAAAGCGLVCLGRVRMLGLPDGTGATGPLVGALVITAARLLATLAAVALLVLAYTESAAGSRRDAADYLRQSLEAWGAGMLLWSVADLAMLPAVAIAGAAIPSYPLRRRVGGATVLLQVSGVLFVLLVAGLYLDGRPGPGAPPARGGRPAAGGGLVPAEVGGLVAGVGLVVVLLLYTVAYSSLYAAGARAVREARQAEEDEDY